MDEKEAEAIRLLDEAVEKYQPRYVVGLFSGGHDSLVVNHLASQRPYFSFSCHVNTGIGIERTRQFVRDTCADWGVELREYKAAENTRADGTPDPQIYEELVRWQGFPGPSHHRWMYQRLKERGLRRMLRALTRERKEMVLLVTGIRQAESQRRMAHSYENQIWEGTKVWVAPIFRFDKVDVTQYIARHNLKRNPVADNLHMSGECLCGAFAKPGELDNIAFWYPEVAAEIRALEERTRTSKHWWGWEQSPPRGYRQQQAALDFDSLPLCSSCILTHLHDGDEAPLNTEVA